MGNGILFVLLTACILTPINILSQDPDEQSVVQFVKREEWGARNPRDTTPLHIPVPLVVIHHTSTVPRCFDREACSDSMRQIQDYHMDVKNWWDIGYNFGVGSDGAVYEGRGWDNLGAQSLHFNEVSIGITLIGNWSLEVPPANQLSAVNALLQAGVDLGYLFPDYQLFGHRDVRDTQCPGDALYQEIQTWPHYTFIQSPKSRGSYLSANEPSYSISLLIPTDFSEEES
ncbi:hypothetical protein PYW08_008252 [Mythimna loreyi]|uniref:Uncharacterized protein n=1 Tax=Mythimna loreyi TaxID=667449 RepID=A0ACC2QDK2_9NEOP|nr:hypothetical protein PYW08_008252 [Mythimna loreyi]